MSTKITINVSGNRLLQQSREAQTANRQQQAQKEVDEKFLADVRRYEQAELARQAIAQREGAVPEYQIQEQTSAQRGGGMGGWLDVTYMPRKVIFGLPFEWADDDCFQVSVGSGNGTKWATKLIKPGFDKSDPPIGTATYYNSLNVGYVVYARSPQNTTVPIYTSLPEGAVVLADDIRKSTYVLAGINQTGLVPYYREFGLAVGFGGSGNTILDVAYHVLPVNNDNAIVLVPTNQSYYVNLFERTVAVGGAPPNIYTNSIKNSFQFIELGVGSALQFALYPYPGIIQRVFCKYPLEETATFPEQPAEAWFAVDLAWCFVNGANAFYPTNYFDVTSPAQSRYNKDYRETAAFVVNSNRVREIEVPTEVSELFSVRYPSREYIINGAFGSYQDPEVPAELSDQTFLYGWIQKPMTPYIGASSDSKEILGLARNTGTDYRPQPLIFGTPGTYKYFAESLIDTRFWQYAGINDELPNLLVSLNPATYPVSLFAPDPAAPQSAFKYMRDVYVATKDEDLPSTDLAVFTTEGSRFKWPFLNSEQKQFVLDKFPSQSSGPYTLTLTAPDNSPTFDFSYYRNTFNEAVAIEVVLERNTWLTADQSKWRLVGADPGYYYMRAEGWTKYSRSIRLSPARILPPSIYLEDPESDGHPYLGGKYNNLHTLCMLAWTAGGKSWIPQLLALGFKGSDLRP